MISERPSQDVDWIECIRCQEADAVDDAGLCGRCHWAVRAEVEYGLHDMRDYLLGWARFAEWCRARGQTTH